jgi:hypothetical protein
LQVRLIALAPLALLVACATPREACINAATRDVRTLDRLVAETEGNIARGYALETVERVDRRFVPCRDRGRIVRDPDGTTRVVYDGPSFCWEDVIVTAERPRAIDIAAERRILASTRTERARKGREAERAVAACVAAHPEG